MIENNIQQSEETKRKYFIGGRREKGWGDKLRLQRVRLKDNSGSSVTLNKEKKRVWLSRFWFSVRRRQNKRKSSLENTFNAIKTMTVEPECKFNKN